VGAAVLTAKVSNASGYGRVLRTAHGSLERIVEDADEPWDGAPAEVNLGTYAFALPGLWESLDQLSADNAQGELYLSWLPERVQGGAVTVEVVDPAEAIQVNDRVQLAQAEAALQRRTQRRLMLAGVTITDPESTWIDCDVEVGQDTVIAPGTVIRGRTRIGSDCLIGPFAAIGTPFGLLVLKGTMDSFPISLEEAAVLDGASAFRTLWSVILPTAVPSLLVVGVWQFLYSWNEFFLSLVVMTNQSMKTVPLLPLVFQGPYMTDPGALFAILTVVSVVPMVVYAGVQKWFVRGLMEGGIKE